MTIKIDDPKAKQGRSVLADFDLAIRADITEIVNGGGPHTFSPSGFEETCADRCCVEETCALCKQSDDANPDHEAAVPFKEIFGIGWPEDLSAGLRGGYLNSAPMFDCVLDALEWAADHEVDIQMEVE